MKTRRFLGLLLALMLALPLMASAQTVAELPRNETMYFGGQQWGSVNGWNPLSDDMNNAMAVTQSVSGSRIIMFETLYMYNMLDGSMKPLLADGDYQWNDAMTEMTVKLKAAAKWSDGTPVTSADVAYTFDTNVKIGNTRGNTYKPFIDSIVPVDDKTFTIKAKLNDDGKAVNPLQLICFLEDCYIAQNALIQTIETL